VTDLDLAVQRAVQRNRIVTELVDTPNPLPSGSAHVCLDKLLLDMEQTARLVKSLLDQARDAR